jgi:hypothetical protein
LHTCKAFANVCQSPHTPTYAGSVFDVRIKSSLTRGIVITILSKKIWSSPVVVAAVAASVVTNVDVAVGGKIILVSA